jgi:hypothetical protein
MFDSAHDTFFLFLAFELKPGEQDISCARLPHPEGEV